MEVRPQYLPARWSLDWPIALILIIFGIIGIRMASDPLFWNRWMGGDDASGTPVGIVAPRTAGIRLKKAGSEVWQDLTEDTEVSEGDMISTSDGSTATLFLGSKDRFEIQPSSLVVVHLPKRRQDGGETFWSDLRGAEKSDGVLEIKKGSVDIAMSKGAVKVIAQGKTVKLEGAKNAKVRLEIPKAGDLSPIRIVSTSESIKIKSNAPILKSAEPTLAPVILPKVISHAAPGTLFPSDGAKFVSKDPVKIRFRWKADIDSQSVEVAFRKSGTEDYLKTDAKTLDLGNGNYEWKVRSRSDDGKYSDWSPASAFTISDPPVAPVAPAIDSASKTAPPLADTLAVKHQQELQMQLKLQQQQQMAAAENLKLERERKAREEEARKQKLEDEELAKKRAEKYASIVAAAQIKTGKPSNGERSIASEFRSVSAGIAPPLPVLPGSSWSLSSGRSLIFSWVRTDSTDSFVLQISRDPSFSSIHFESEMRENYVVFQEHGPEKYDLHTISDTDGTFYWRVRAVSSNLQSEWSEVRRVDISE